MAMLNVPMCTFDIAKAHVRDYNMDGGVAERSKAPDWQSGGAYPLRGFESRRRLHILPEEGAYPPPWASIPTP